MTSNPYGVSRFRRAFVHFIGGRALQASARAALVLILVRVLEVGDYGVYMLIVGLSEMMLEVVSLGLLPVAQRFVPQMVLELPLRKLVAFVTTLIVLQSTILIGVGYVISNYWGSVTGLFGFSATQTEVSQIAVWLLVVVPMFRFSVELLEGHLEQGKAQVSRALMPTGRAVVIVTMLFLGMGIDLQTVLLIDIWVTVGCLLLAWLLLIRSMKSLHNPDANGTLPLPEMLRFGWHMAPVGLMGATGSPGALRMVLANTLGVIESGLFAFLQSLQRLVGRYLPGTLLRGIIRPVLLARAYQPGGMNVVESGASLLVKSNLLLVAAGCVVVAVGGDDLVLLLSGGKFAEAGGVLLIMFFALGITSQKSILDMVMQITNHTSVLRLTALITPITLYFIWRFADYGLETAIAIAALGYFTSISVAMAILVYLTKRFVPDWRGILVLLSAAAAGIGAGIGVNQYTNMYVAAFAGGIVYLLGLLLMRPYRPSEHALVKRALGGKAGKLMRPFTYSTDVDHHREASDG